MRHPFPRIAAAFALAVAMTIFTGGALAGNGPGNENAPGQVKQDLGIQSAQTIAQAGDAQVAEQPAAAQQSDHVSIGQEKKQANASVSSTAGASTAASDTAPGIKPSSTTDKWTHCLTGGTAADAAHATCTGVQGTASTEADVSKQYGNGKTAAEIAVGRSGIGVTLTGPGNSQPHKVWDCRHKTNPSGGVDVHAIKSYSLPPCAASTPTTALVAPCGFVVAAQTSVVGKSHGHGQGLVHNKHLQTTTSSTLKPASSQKCGSAAVTPQTAITTSVGTSIASATTTPNAKPKVTSSIFLPPAAAAPVTNTGGVLGAQKTLAKPEAKHAVLGAVGNVAGSSLPFTGFPVWLAVVVALALITAGLLLRRRSAVSRL